MSTLICMLFSPEFRPPHLAAVPMRGDSPVAGKQLWRVRCPRMATRPFSTSAKQRSFGHESGRSSMGKHDEEVPRLIGSCLSRLWREPDDEAAASTTSWLHLPFIWRVGQLAQDKSAEAGARQRLDDDLNTAPCGVTSLPHVDGTGPQTRPVSLMSSREANHAAIRPAKSARLGQPPSRASTTVRRTRTMTRSIKTGSAESGDSAAIVGHTATNFIASAAARAP